jgi:DNA-binding transcriptional MerR regulator
MKMPNGIFSISAFAEFSRTTKDTLLYYDKLKLFSPRIRGENGYRYYAPDQLATMNVIRTLQDLGLSLGEIKELIDARNPENFDITFDQQIKKLDRRIQELMNNRMLLKTLHSNIQEGLGVDEDSLFIEVLPEASLVIGEENDYSNGQDAYDALTVFYKVIHEKYPEMNLNYPVWGLFDGERIRNRDWKWPNRYYFHHHNGDKKRPKQEYAVGYSRGGYGQCDDLYERVLDFIEEMGYEIHGNCYEEYILNEICISNESGYLIRLVVGVKKRENNK